MLLILLPISLMGKAWAPEKMKDKDRGDKGDPNVLCTRDIRMVDRAGSLHLVPTLQEGQAEPEEDTQHRQRQSLI